MNTSAIYCKCFDVIQSMDSYKQRYAVDNYLKLTRRYLPEDDYNFLKEFFHRVRTNMYGNF